MADLQASPGLLVVVAEQSKVDDMKIATLPSKQTGDLVVGSQHRGREKEEGVQEDPEEDRPRHAKGHYSVAAGRPIGCTRGPNSRIFLRNVVDSIQAINGQNADKIIGLRVLTKNTQTKLNL